MTETRHRSMLPAAGVIAPAIFAVLLPFVLCACWLKDAFGRLDSSGRRCPECGHEDQVGSVLPSSKAAARRFQIIVVICGGLLAIGSLGVTATELHSRANAYALMSTPISYEEVMLAKKKEASTHLAQIFGKLAPGMAPAQSVLHYRFVHLDDIGGRDIRFGWPLWIAEMRTSVLPKDASGNLPAVDRRGHTRWKWPGVSFQLPRDAESRLFYTLSLNIAAVCVWIVVIYIGGAIIRFCSQRLIVDRARDRKLRGCCVNCGYDLVL